MALLKHRGITRASYDALIAPDPNTEYTVLETDGTFTRYIGSKDIKDKTAARLDNDGNLNLGGKNITNVNELTVAELTSLVESIIVKKTLELQADINFDGHKAIHPNIENGTLENELDANSQEILNPVLRGAKRIGENPTSDDDIIDLKTARLLFSRFSYLYPDGVTDIVLNSTPQTVELNPKAGSKKPSLPSKVIFYNFKSQYNGLNSEVVIGSYNKEIFEELSPANGYPEQGNFLILLTGYGSLYIFATTYDGENGIGSNYEFYKKIYFPHSLCFWGKQTVNATTVGVDFGVGYTLSGGIQDEND